MLALTSRFLLAVAAPFPGVSPGSTLCSYTHLRKKARISLSRESIFTVSRKEVDAYGYLVAPPTNYSVRYGTVAQVHFLEHPTGLCNRAWGPG